RDNVKIIIGGYPVSDDIAEKVGADAAAETAMDGVKKCKRWMGD
ncbi:cobalamin-binding protein, partial [candidate division MSBL1 archaeon SCGC-AAA259B11]